MALRYWQGTGVWDGATSSSHWSATSWEFAQSGNAAPGLNDDIIFDSFSGVGVCTLSSTFSNNGCRSIILTASKTTFSGSGGLTVSGSVTLGGLTTSVFSSYTGTLTIINSCTYSSSGAPRSQYFSPSIIVTNGTFSLGSTFSSTNTLSFNGPVTGKTNNFGLTVDQLILQNGASMSFGSSNVLVTTLIDVFGGTLDAGTSNVTFLNANTDVILPNPSCLVNGSMYNVTIYPLAGIRLYGNSGYSFAFNNLTLRTNSNTYGSARIMFMSNCTITGTFSCIGSDAKQVIVSTSDLAGPTPGTQRTITSASVFLNRVIFEDIIGAGVATWTGTNIGDFGSNSNITLTPAATQSWIGTSGGSWSIASNWTSRVPLPQDNVIINNAFSASQVINIDTNILGRNVDFTGISGNPTLAFPTSYGQQNSFWINGDLTLTSGMVVTSPTDYYMLIFHIRNRTSTYTSGGASIYSTINIKCYNGTLYLGGDSIFIGLLKHFYGTFDLNNYNLSCTNYQNDIDNSQDIQTLNMGSGVFTINTNSGFGMNVSSSATINSSTGTLKINGLSNTFSKFFSGGAGKSYHTVWFTGVTGQTFAIYDSNMTINTIIMDYPNTLVINAGITLYVTTLNISGAAGNLNIINSGSPGSPSIISKTSGQIVQDYLDISDSTATGGAIFYAGANSTSSGGGNTGWIFTGLPIPTINLIGIGSIKGIAKLVI